MIQNKHFSRRDKYLFKIKVMVREVHHIGLNKSHPHKKVCGEGAYENNGEWDYIRKPEIINEDGCRPSCDNMASKGNAEIWCHTKVEIYYTQ